MNDDHLALEGIGQISIRVHDIERATGFYRDALRLRYLFAAPGMAFFDCGGVRLMLGTPSAPEFDHPASILYYRVADIHAAHSALLARNVRCERGPERVARTEAGELWLAFFRDSEENLLALMSEVAPG